MTKKIVCGSGIEELGCGKELPDDHEIQIRWYKLWFPVCRDCKIMHLEMMRPDMGSPEQEWETLRELERIYDQGRQAK